MRIAEGYAETLEVVKRAAGVHRPTRSEKIAATASLLAIAVVIALFKDANGPLLFVVTAGVIALALGSSTWRSKRCAMNALSHPSRTFWYWRSRSRPSSLFPKVRPTNSCALSFAVSEKLHGLPPSTAPLCSP